MFFLNSEKTNQINIIYYDTIAQILSNSVFNYTIMLVYKSDNIILIIYSVFLYILNHFFSFTGYMLEIANMRQNLDSPYLKILYV